MADLSKRLKTADNLNGELQRRVDELTHDLGIASNENQRLTVELTKLKQQYSDLQDRYDVLARENKQLSGD